MTAAKPGLGQLLMNNMLLLDYTESFFLTKFGTELSPDMFDAKNEKGMEAVLYVSYKAVHGKAVSIQNSIKWPVDHNYPNQFNKTISDWVKELAKHGKIPTALAANLQSCLRLASGQRTIALLLLLSGHALSHVHRHSSSLRHTDVKVPFIVKDEELHCSPVIAACLALEKRKNATLLAEFATLRNEAQATAKYISGKLSKYSDAVEQQSNIAANREELLLTRGLNQKILSIPEVEAIKEEQAEIWRDIISKGEKQKDLKQQIHKALGQEIHPFQIGVDIKGESNEGKDGEFRMIDLPNLLQRSSESLKDYAQILPDQEEVFRMERSGKEVVQLLSDPHQKASQDLLVQQTSRLEAQQKLAKEIKDLAASVAAHKETLLSRLKSLTMGSEASFSPSAQATEAGVFSPTQSLPPSEVGGLASPLNQDKPERLLELGTIEKPKQSKGFIQADFAKPACEAGFPDGLQLLEYYSYSQRYINLTICCGAPDPAYRGFLLNDYDRTGKQAIQDQVNAYIAERMSSFEPHQPDTEAKLRAEESVANSAWDDTSRRLSFSVCAEPFEAQDLQRGDSTVSTVAKQGSFLPTLSSIEARLEKLGSLQTSSE